MSRIALLNDKLYMTVSSQQVLPGEKPAGGKADMQHWRTVLASTHPPQLRSNGFVKPVGTDVLCSR